MEHQPTADKAVVEDVIMSMDPAENLDESTSALVSPRDKVSKTQVLIHQSTIKVPDYRHQKGFLHLAWDVKYGKFVLDVQSMNDQLIDRMTMERIWVEHVHGHYIMDDTGIKAVMEPALADALRQVHGYNGFDAEAYWQLQSVTTDLRNLWQDWRSKELKEDQNNGLAQTTTRESMEDTTRRITSSPNKIRNSSDRTLNQQRPAPAQQEAFQTAVPTYTPYVHPGIIRRKIDESYEFDEEDEEDKDTEMEWS
ncbi:hypothetical protein BKA64DRAFT_699113 [Cadophora sp. MPI-SDFR-AT-0126]|nr:hypothetical protein BKA64DRAFT_699113 [Leotiomycetes sp. MPI-SDFR-AT-0126]